MATEKQINASRENGKLSRGPITEAGKAVCKKNAIKHALTGASKPIRSWKSKTKACAPSSLSL